MIGRYETRLHRQFSRDLAQLRDLQRARPTRVSVQVVVAAESAESASAALECAAAAAVSSAPAQNPLSLESPKNASETIVSPPPAADPSPAQPLSSQPSAD